MDDRQRKHGIEPRSESGKAISSSDRQKLYKDKRYGQLNDRRNTLSHPGLLKPSAYLTGKKKK